MTKNARDTNNSRHADVNNCKIMKFLRLGRMYKLQECKFHYEQKFKLFFYELFKYLLAYFVIIVVSATLNLLQ